jgi:hypothetical protein
MDGRVAIHVVSQPLLLISTVFWTWDTLVNRLSSVVIKSQPEPTQSVAGQRETSVHYFSCSRGTDTESTISALGHITLNLCYAFSGICESCSTFWCV